MGIESKQAEVVQFLSVPVENLLLLNYYTCTFYDAKIRSLHFIWNDIGHRLLILLGRLAED